MESSKLFSEMLARSGQSTTSRQTIRIVPQRNKPTFGQRSPISDAGREAADCWYRCGVEVAKVFYKKIDARYPNRSTDLAQREQHRIKFDEAKTILNENRNQIVDAVLPLFEITHASKSHEPTEADEHAADYFVKNVFYVMTQSFIDWTPEFVQEDEVDVVKQIAQSVAATQSDKLTRQLMNFAFRFRPVVAP